MHASERCSCASDRCEPLARLWHAATVLREHRGGGHAAALVAAGIDGCGVPAPGTAPAAS